MSSVLANSNSELKQIGILLDKNLPAHRRAYSDRTAWMMACLSELAYIRFNPIFSNQAQKDYFLENISKLVDENKKSSLVKLIELVGYDHQAEKEKLKSELNLLRMKLVETFDENGTQAFLASNDQFLFLTFRGTEATSIKDIKVDADAKVIKCETGGTIHTGFKEAFEDVSMQIQKILDKDEFQAKPLFISGHSLGGALATIAAKELYHKGGIAACYTFGSPRVGDAEWISSIKTPFYRLVNAADCVTMLPPGDEIITLISWIFGFLGRVGEWIKSWLLSNFQGYLHGGNMRYLTNCPAGQYDNVKLLYTVSFLYRMKGLIIKKLPWRAFLADHSISIYKKKLAIIARSRNL